MKYKVSEFGLNSNYTLVCNPKIFKDARKQHIKNLLEIKDWIDILDDNFVCILNCEDFFPPSSLFDESLDVISADGRALNENFRYVFFIYWRGALEIKNKNSIQCIKIEY